MNYEQESKLKAFNRIQWLERVLQEARKVIPTSDACPLQKVVKRLDEDVRNGWASTETDFCE